MDTIIITANLGHLKAFRIEKTPTRGHRLELIEDLELIDAHGGIASQFSDRSGRFHRSAIGRQQWSNALSAYEAAPMELEVRRRLVKQVGEQINAILEREQPGMWYFAAGPEVHEHILEEIDAQWRERLTRAERVDIVNLPVIEVLPRFQW